MAWTESGADKAMKSKSEEITTTWKEGSSRSQRACWTMYSSACLAAMDTYMWLSMQNRRNQGHTFTPPWRSSWITKVVNHQGGLPIALAIVLRPFALAPGLVER